MAKSADNLALPKIHFTSFENASLVRKFTILYFFISILPIGFLYLLYMQIYENGNIVIEEYDFFVILTGMVILVGAGYLGMRSIFGRIIALVRAERQTVEELLGPKKIKAVDMNNNELAILTQSFQEITAHLEENIRNLEIAKRTLHSVLSKVGQGLSSFENIDSFLNLIIETITDALEAKTGALLLLDKEKKEYSIKSIIGSNAGKIKKRNNEPLTELIELHLKSRQPVVIGKESSQNPFPKIFTLPMLLSPLILHDNVLGMIIVCGRDTDKTFDEEEKSLLFNISLQTAVAIENARLNEDAEKTYFEIVSTLAMAVEARDTYSRGHSDRVAQFCIKIAQEMNLSQDDIITLREAAKLHDLGKIGIVDDVLRKKGPLTAQETEIMKKHAEIGEGIIKFARSLRRLCDLIRHHHEKLDGSGYPDGLKGDQINLLVRILAVADIYDALTSSRPYRDPFESSKALETLYDMKDQVDLKVVEALERSLVS